MSLVFLLTSCCTINFNVGPQKQNDKTFDANTAYKSTVRITARAKEGGGELACSGFAIDKDNIMTAGHCCVGILELQAQGEITDEIYMDYYAPDGETILTQDGLKIKDADELHDICVMSKKSHGILPVKFVDYDEVKIHTPAYIVGAPLGVYATIYPGEVVQKALDLGFGAMHKLIVSAAAASGNSGSPIFNEAGDVIGMLVMGDGSFDHLSIGTATPDLIKFLQIIGLKKI